MVSLKEEDSAINAFAWGWVDEGRCGYAAEVEATLKAQHLPRPCWPVTKAQMNRPLRCAAGYRHTLFATAKGHLKVCGSDTYGQLGVGGPRDFAAAEREKVVEVQHHEDDRREFFKSVAAGDGTSYALSASGTLFAWGRGKFGALGHGGKERDQPVPRVIERFAKVMISKVAAGRWHCLALGRTGKVYAWGRNHHGQLGSGDVSRCNGGNVVEVSFGLQTEGGMRETATCISAGETHSLSVMKVQRLDGSEVLAVFAWGCPDNGRLGGVDPRRHMAPQEIQSLSIMLRKKRISLSEKPGAVTCGGMHNIAITEPSGNLISWGYGGDGALGYGDVWDRVEPVMIGSIHSVAEVACGYRHTLAVRGNMTEGATTQFGELWAWGLNAYGELGLGDDNARLQPTLVRALQGAIITSVAAGHRHSVALTLGDVRKMRDDERCARARAANARARARHCAGSSSPRRPPAVTRVCVSRVCFSQVRRVLRDPQEGGPRRVPDPQARHGAEGARPRDARRARQGAARSAGAHRLRMRGLQVRAGHALLQGDRARADRRLEQVEELRDHVRVPAVQADRDLWLVRAHLP